MRCHRYNQQHNESELAIQRLRHIQKLKPTSGSKSCMLHLHLLTPYSSKIQNSHQSRLLNLATPISKLCTASAQYCGKNITPRSVGLVLKLGSPSLLQT